MNEAQQTLCKGIGLGLGAAMFVTSLVVCAVIVRHNDRLKEEVAELKLGLSEATVERDTRGVQLAPFLDLAEKQFPKAPPDERLRLLNQRVQALTAIGTKLRGRRHLEADAIARIRAKLELAPHLEVEAGASWQDPESLALAAELKSIFEGAGFKVRDLAQYIIPEGFTGVSIFSKHEYNHVLSEAITQIFREISQQPIEWAYEDPIGTARSGKPAPDVKIIVGPR